MGGGGTEDWTTGGDDEDWIQTDVAVEELDGGRKKHDTFRGHGVEDDEAAVNRPR